MGNKQHESYHMSPPDSGDGSHERRQGDRREMKKKGFAYISTVGWICRRERARRNGDSLFE